jgi:hypothetical protein
LENAAAYEWVLLMDADCVALRNLDHLLEKTEDHETEDRRLEQALNGVQSNREGHGALLSSVFPEEKTEDDETEDRRLEQA